MNKNKEQNLKISEHFKKKKLFKLIQVIYNGDLV